MFTAPQIAWHGAGRPALGYDVTTHHGHCATCGAAIDGVAVHIKEIECPTLTQHADFMAHGQHVCPACAWLFGAGKGKPGNFIATPAKYEQAVISLSSVVEDKRPWLTIIREIAKLPSDTPVCGVLTTDVKPRLWPRMQAATVGAFGLYVYSPDDDLSAFVPMDLSELLQAIDTIIPAMEAKFSKTEIKRGLFSNLKKCQKNLTVAMELEQQIASLRKLNSFIPAVLMAGVGG